MAKFGYEIAGGSWGNFGDTIVGSVFTCPLGGQANSITAYVKRLGTLGGSAYFKYGIYKHSDLSLVGYTVEGSVNVAAWVTLAITSGGVLEVGVDYVLVGFGKFELDEETLKSRYPSLTYNAGDVNQSHSQAVVYDGFPNPLVPVHGDRKYSIYCTYTPPSAVKAGLHPSKPLAIILCE
jgi:hypothetical protein